MTHLEKKKMKKKLILFDCDGVLVDSEYVASRVFSEALAPYGYHLSTEESIKKFTGLNEHVARQMIFEESGIEIPENYWALQQSKLLEAYSIELTPLMQPVLEMLEKSHFPRGVASNSSRRHVDHCLKLSQQYNYFSEEFIFTSQQVKKPKPAPDLFLFAAEQMGFSPEECLVVEDSSAGTRAAIEAGMDVVIFLGGMHTRYEWYKENISSYKKPMVSDSKELLAFLESRLINNS